MDKIQIKFDRFPNGHTKAACFSFDDGREQDRRLVDLMNQYGLKGTFHLNTGFLGREGYIAAEEVRQLYLGHEVSAHTVNHPFLEQSPQEQVIEEILSNRAELEALVGYPVRGMSYPYGTYNDSVVAALPAVGIEYARTVQSHGQFVMPANLLTWHPTCHHKGMVEAARQFVDSKSRYSRMELLFVWGHSFEFDNDNNWELVDQLGSVLEESTGIWMATMSELVSYTNALKSLRFSVNRKIVHNPSAVDVWISAAGESVVIPAGALVNL
ncbi:MULTISPECIES: polysaccharide deacetylase family protein [unclassified Paenibacillus]|uniref:polysaccharide deacetylase family protein n=1 Tax=unclassified Paenibacillus TaxID=185978 RepID=UPI002F3EE5FE